MVMKLSKFLLMLIVPFMTGLFVCCDDDDEEEERREFEKKLSVGSPYDKLIIERIFPSDGTGDVEIFSQVQLSLRYSLDGILEVKSAYLDAQYYRVKLADFFVTNQSNGEIVEGALNMNDGKQIVFTPRNHLDFGTKYRVYAKMVIEKRIEMVWYEIKDRNGSDYSEERTIEFTTVERPSSIQPKHVLYSYPADRQRNFLVNEYNEAYFATKIDYSYLFNKSGNEGFENKLRITPHGGSPKYVDFDYSVFSDTADEKFGISVPVGKLNLEKNVVYNLAVVKINVGGNEEILYSVDFRTSIYGNFQQKMDNMTAGNASASQIIGPIYELISSVDEVSSEPEGFDRFEYNSDTIKDNLLKLYFDYDNSQWYKEKIAPLLYENEDLLSVVGPIEPPMDAKIVKLARVDSNAELSVAEIESGMCNTLASNRVGAFNLSVMSAVNTDLYHCHVTIINRGNVPEGAEKIINSDVPSLIEGCYPIIIKYVVPGRNEVTSECRVSIELVF